MPIPHDSWASVGIGFVVQLPKTTTGLDAICVVVDRLTEMVHFAATTLECGAQQTAELFLANVYRLHGMPATTVTNMGSVFTNNFFSKLSVVLGIKQLSKAYHLQRNGQIERANRVMEDTLRHFVSLDRDD